MACGTQILDPYYLGFSAIFTVLYQALFFVIAAGFKFDKVTDFAGGSNFALVVVSTLMLADTYYLRQMLVSCAVVLWAVRLSGYLLIRILKTGKDARFDTMNRGFSLEFAGFWVAQAVWVIAVSSPAVVLNSRCDSDPALGAADAAGLALFAVGFVLEAVADSDKFRFRSDPANAGRWQAGSGSYGGGAGAAAAESLLIILPN